MSNTTTIRRLVLPLLLLALAAQSGCTRVLEFRVLRLIGVRATSIDDDGFRLMVHCELQNSSPVGAELRDIHFRTSNGQHVLGRGQLAGPVRVKANSRFELVVPVQVRYADLPADLPQQAAQGQLMLTTAARFTAVSPLGTYKLRLVSTGSTMIDQALKAAVTGTFNSNTVRVARVQLMGLQLSRVRLRVTLRARNRLSFPVRIRRARYRLDINGAPFGGGSIDAPLLLPAGQATTLELAVVARPGAVGQAIGAMLGSDPRFRVRGTLWIDPIGGVSALPLDLSADSSVFGRQP